MTDSTIVVMTVCSSSEQGKLAAESLTGPILSTARQQRKNQSGQANYILKSKLLYASEILQLPHFAKLE